MRRGCWSPTEMDLTGTLPLLLLLLVVIPATEESLEKNRSKIPDLRFPILGREVGVRSIGEDSDAELQWEREGSIMGGVGRAAW